MICIIGAGPAGAYAALKLAEAGEKVRLFEEHAVVGKPVQCTGIVTRSLFELVEPSDEYLINELEKVKVSSENASVEIPLKEYVLCRDKFDSWLVRKAVRAGAELRLNHSFTGFKNNRAVFNSKGKTIQEKYDYIIGADGPSSTTGRAAGLLKQRQYYIGAQATIKGRFEKKTFSVHFGPETDFFWWIVPESETFARVGIAAKKYTANAFEQIQKVCNGTIVEKQAGPIPMFDVKQKAQKEDVYLVGDAAGFCKNTTGGGIITGMMSAKLAAESILTGKDYERLLKPLRKELLIHKQIRDVLNKFTTKDYDRLINLMADSKVKKILSDYPREYPSRFVWKLIIAQPRLLYFIKHLLNAG